ncbi:MAG: hypothetical protein V4717_12230 [Bacteroidota bacterium]
MKKAYFALLTLTVLTACRKSAIQPIALEPEVSKTAVWTIAPVADYTVPYYNNASAEIKLAVAKQLQNPYREEIIWDTIFQRRPLAQFMQLNPYVLTKTFSNLKDSKENITVGYSISYITGPLNAQQFSAYGAVAEKGNSTHRVAVNL